MNNLKIARKPQMTEKQKRDCVELVRSGSKIAEVARQFKVDRKTVSSYLKKPNLERKKYDSTLRFKLTAQQVTNIKNEVDSNETILWKEVKAKFELDCDLSVISKTLKKSGYKRYKKRAKSSKLNEEPVCQQRRDFCDEYKHWTADQWERSAFLDESYVHSRSNLNNCYYHSTPETNDAKKRYKFSAAKSLKVNFLSFISTHISKIIFFSDNCNEKVFVDLLENRRALYELNLYACESESQQESATVFLDNASYHSTPLVDDLFKKYPSTTMVKLPPYSNDLNPIENFFGLLKRKINTKILHMTNTKQIEKEILIVSNELVEKGIVRNLIRSMPERIQAVIEANGGPTRF